VNGGDLGCWRKIARGELAGEEGCCGTIPGRWRGAPAVAFLLAHSLTYAEGRGNVCRDGRTTR
jgi:hypothetical protein